MATSEELLAQHIKKRQEMIDSEAKLHFSYDLEAGLTQAERDANTKLLAIRELVANNHELNRAIHSFYDNKETMEGSQLFEVLNKMPKGGIHHIHTTAANTIESYLNLTYDDRVYFNLRERIFKVYPNHQDVAEGYIQCTQLRSFNVDFDQQVKDQIMLRKEQAEGLESHDIWKSFQHKFTKVGELGKFVPFFRKITKNALEACIKQNCYIVEYRHISGMLFDEEQKSLSFLEELRVIRDIVDELQKDTPHFEFRLILTGLKIVGRAHIEKILKHIAVGSCSKDKKLAELVSGFDMVNEEDFTEEINHFSEQILGHKGPIQINGEDMPVFFHAGETHQKHITNLHDAVLLNSKRVGHGFQLALFPHLQQLFIEQDICIEACPLSNFVLGYTKDLRVHPINYLMTRGIQFSISSDDPGLFGYEGVTLDYVYATAAWELSIRDLKKCSLNGIKYASVSEEKKADLLKNHFEPQWKEWIDWLNNLTVQKAE